MFQPVIKGKNCYWLFLLFAISSIFFARFGQAATSTNAVEQNLDAVAIRILPNVEHYGIEHWYLKQGFSGSPQYLIVDGYEAIRDGRTVYVNATNIVGTTIHTNIYLISYNQDSKAGTTDALAQIIANWKFNNNLTSPGKCAYTVAATSTCLIDSDCLVGFCDSLKAKVTRDVKRLATLAEIKDSLNKYHEANGKFPDLPTGSYIPHLTVSTWPSWQNTFATQLGLDKSLIDPINKLGSCSGYDAATCWNKNLSTSAIKTDPDLEFPDNSLALAYQSQNSGNQYKICASMESAENFNTADGSLKTFACSVKLGSTTISSGLAFEAFNLQGEVNKEFNGYVKITNPNGNPLTWNLSFEDDVSKAFSDNLVLVDTNNPNQKKIYSKKATKEGSFEIKLNVTDNRNGATASTTAKIIIGKDKPRIEAENTDFILNKNKLQYSFYIYDNSAGDEVPDYTLKLNGGVQDKSQQLKNGDVKTGLRLKTERIERGKFKITIFQETGIIGGISNTNDTIFRFSVSLKNSVANKDFTITLKQDKPIFDYQCEENVRKYDYYNCLIKVSNEEDHDITYTISGLTGTNPSTNLSTTTTAKNTVTISGYVIANSAPQPPVIGEGTCTTNNDSRTLQRDAATKKLRDNYNSILSKGIRFITFSTSTTSTSTNKTGGTISTSTPGNETYQYDKNVLPKSSFLSPILKTFALIKASFVTGEALAGKYTGDTGGTCQTPEQLYEAYCRDLRALDETISTTTPQSVFQIKITARNEYNASSTSGFSLKVNTYCGDGVKQAPNQEKRGGLYNDGVEECDGVAGVAVSATDSSAKKQYACTTGTDHGVIPNPITTNDFCRATGGFCGDGICGEDDSTYTADDIFEKYDPGNNTDQYCHADCAYCGDGIVQTSKGEVCDPGDPYSVQASLGEACSKRCKIVRDLKILQVYPSNATDHTISVEAALSALANNEEYPSFRNSVSIENISTDPGEIDYKVDTITISEFNTSTTGYLPTGNPLEKYNLIVFGFGAGDSEDLNSSSKLLLENFIQNGGMVIFGKGTIFGPAPLKIINGVNLRVFNSFSQYSGVSAAYPGTPDSNSVKKSSSTAFAATQLLDLPNQFAINTSSKRYKLASDGSSCGNQCLGAVCTASSSRLINWFDFSSSGPAAVKDGSSWASTCNRVGLLQLSSTSSGLNPEEYKTFGNLVYYLSTLVSGDNF